MTEALLLRLVAQALQYGELMLDPAELVTFTTWTHAHPHASCSAGGRLYVFRDLPVRVLQLEPTTTTNERPNR